MGDIVAGAIQKQLSGNTLGAEKQMLQQTQNGQKFENILQQSNGQTNTLSTNQTNKINDSKLENMRVDLMQRYQELPDGVPKVTAIFPEYLDTKTKMTNFKSVLNQAVSSVGSIPEGKNVVNRFSQTENEWLKLDTIMRSDKELSQGELLGLQARLYQVSQHIDVLSKVVDQMTGGVKTILNTNV
jgi:hypothetical protein